MQAKLLFLLIGVLTLVTSSVLSAREGAQAAAGTGAQELSADAEPGRTEPAA